ncbi:hypothetical protein FOA52_010239 [Chlamydomonas sp. UWO 241]|nr:hypothetical protein FOA52_010239 [Chlamydomonas sp. UWO 241]
MSQFEPVPPFSDMHVFIGDSVVVVQPVVKNASHVDTLSVDLRTGSVQALVSPPQRSTPTPIVAVLGVSKLFKGYAVVVVTAAKVVASVLGADIYQITKTSIITSEEARMAKDNKALLRLLADGVDPDGSGRAMYFSHYYDVTLSAQKTANVAMDGSPAMQSSAVRADKDFFWNFRMSRPLIDAGAHRFVMPCIMGFVRQVPGLSFRTTGGNRATRTATLTLIARRWVLRAGTRHWRRGCDADGNAANFVETEQLLQLEDDSVGDTPTVPTLASFVVLRGSIPVMWTELPNIKYKPTRVIGPPETHAPTLAKHMGQMLGSYKDVTAINLVNQHGGEGKLADAFKVAAEEYTKGGGDGLHYVAFDFHKECGAKRYDRISILWDQISADFARHAFFMHGPKGMACKQRGVMRVNCIDCLDRTNVLQGVLGRKALDVQLQKLGLLAEGMVMANAYPEVEAQFKILWADHGDAVSTQYAGTGAMKSMYTRTGKRTMGGIVDDGYKAVARFYLNNFQDGKKQDAVDLATGAYVPEPGASLPRVPRRSPLLPIMFSLIFIVLGVRGGLVGSLGGEESAFALAAAIIVPILVGMAILHLTVSNGSFVASISVEDAIVFVTGGDGCGHANDVFSGCFAVDAEEARRRAAGAAAGVSMPVRLATNIVRFMHDNTGNWDGPAGGGVVSASFINAKPAVGGIGVEPRGGGVLRVLFTVASGAVADTVVRWRWKLRQTQVAVFDVLSDREEARHRALWPAFLAAKAAGKRAQFHRARLVVDGERPGRGAGARISPSFLTSLIKGTSPDELLSLVEQHGQAFNYIHSAAALNQAAQLIARMGCVFPRGGIERMVQLARDQLQSMATRELANTAYALAQLDHRDNDFMATLQKEAKPKMCDFKPHELANTVWALATLDSHADSAFMTALLNEATPRLRDFKPQELANTLWALATLDHTDGAFTAALLKEAMPRLRDFTPQNLANVAWALATLGHTDGAFMAALLEEATPRLRDFAPQNLANIASCSTLWALATLGHTDGVFMAALLKEATPRLRDFTPQALANVAWALATLDLSDGAFMAALLKEAMPRLHDFTPQALSNTAWALATLGHTDGAFMAALLKESMPRLPDFTPQNLANAAWALAALDHADDAFMAALLQQAAIMVPSFDDEGLTQLFLCDLWLKDQHSDVAVPAQLAATCKKAWMEERSNPQPSSVQLEVLAVVRQLPGCAGATSEQATDDRLFSIDIAVQLPDGRRLTVEVDGPSHFLSSPSGRLEGAALLRNRLLEARCWRVVSVPVMTGWVPHAKQGQQAARDYLLSLGVGPVS